MATFEQLYGNNCEIKIKNAEDIIGYQFTDSSLLWEALQVAGSGITTIGGRTVPKGNQRLAIIGDSAIQYALSTAWYESGGSLGMYFAERA